MVFIFLAYFTLYNGLQFHPSPQLFFLMSYAKKVEKYKA